MVRGNDISSNFRRTVFVMLVIYVLCAGFRVYVRVHLGVVCGSSASGCIYYLIFSQKITCNRVSSPS